MASLALTFTPSWALALPTQGDSGPRLRLTAAGEPYAAGQLMVRCVTEVEDGPIRAAIGMLDARVVDAVPTTGLLLVELDADEELESVARRIASIPGVRSVELNYAGETGCAPQLDDTHLAEQWHLNNTGQGGGRPGADIEAFAAWHVERGDPSVVLAIIDSGIDFEHPEFEGRLLQGFDFVNEDDDPSAATPHGTRVAGLAAANAGNGFGVAGVDHACRILPIQVINSNGFGFAFDVIQALEYCAEQRADVVNISLINFPDTTAMNDALQVAHDAGCILVACAGNGGPGDADVSLPGASSLTISIGNTRRDDTRPNNGGTGAALDFVAPGAQTVSVAIGHDDDFLPFGGCSASTPVASGIVTLLLARHPLLSQEQVHELLRLGAEDRVGPVTQDLPGRDDTYGYGRLNVARSLRVLEGCHPALGCRCAPDVPNSSGRTARLRVGGSTFVDDDDLLLFADGLPPDQLGMFLMGDGERIFTPPSALAPLCIGGGSVVRLPSQALTTGPDGVMEYAPGTTRLPAIGAFTPGETWTFQTWFRDGPNTSNVSNAQTVRFR